MNNVKEYRKTATVKAKIFEPGDEDGVASFDNIQTPYISTLENNRHFGNYYECYICVGIKGERWLVEKSIFEQTYTEV